MEKKKLINSYKDYELLNDLKITVKELKIIMNDFFYKSKQKKKNDILRDFQLYLKESYYIQKIIHCWKSYYIKCFNKTLGPAIFKRNICNNYEDFLTGEKMNEINYIDFLSFKDKDGFIYGFHIKSIVNLIEKNHYCNPYNRNTFSEEILEIINKRKIMNKLFKYTEHYEINNDYTRTNLNNHFVSIFQKIDELGNYTQYEWFSQLNNRLLRKLIIELYDIWHYRSQITLIEKKKLCPPYGTPFREIPMHIIQNRSVHIESLTIKNYILKIMTTMINNTNTTDEEKKICSLYILTSLTLVSEEAANSLPWLYQSVI
tara:strand:+ start:612 stop:1559 length:948 start_codon:yes stop_codon:yes gene_type:complete